MRDRSRPSPPLLALAARVPLPPSPKPFSRLFTSTNSSRRPQDIPLPPSPTRPSSALSSTSSNERSHQLSIDSPSAEPGSRWSPYSTPTPPKSNPITAIRRSLKVGSAPVGSESSSTRRSSSIITSSTRGITLQEIVQPSPLLCYQGEAASCAPLLRPTSPLSPSHFNILRRAEPSSSPSPFTSAFEISPSAPSAVPNRRSTKTFWPSRVSGASRNAEQGVAPNKLSEKLSRFVEDTKRKFGWVRRGRSNSIEATRSARELNALDDRLLKAAVWTLFGDSSSALERQAERSERHTVVDESVYGSAEGSTFSTPPHHHRPRELSDASPSRGGPHTTPAAASRRDCRPSPKLPPVAFGPAFVVDADSDFNDRSEIDTSGEETPKASRMIRKVMSVDEIGREVDGDETPTRRHTPRHSVSTPALRDASYPTSKSKIKSEHENEHGEARQPTRIFKDLTNTVFNPNLPASNARFKSQSIPISHSYSRAQVRCHSPLAQTHFPNDGDDLFPPVCFPGKRVTLDSVRLSFASEEGDSEGMEQPKEEQWVDESEEGSENGESHPRHSFEGSNSYGSGKHVQLFNSHASSEFEPCQNTATLSSSPKISSFPRTSPPSFPPPPPARTKSYSSEWLSYNEADEVEEEEEDSFDADPFSSTPTALSRALRTPLFDPNSTDSKTEESPISPPLPPIDRGEDRRRSHPIPYTSSRSFPSLPSLKPGPNTSNHPSSSLPQQIPHDANSSRSLLSFQSSPIRPKAPHSTPTAIVRFQNPSTHPSLRGTFMLSTSEKSERGREGGEGREWS